VAKVNANFPGNPKQHGLPSIQGVIVVCDGVDGRLLALMDSIEITITRTGAATGVAANCLALQNANVATICGCGNQGRISLKALLKVRKLKKLFVFDVDRKQAEKFVEEFGNEIKITAVDRDDLPAALQQSHIVVTCTPSKEPFIRAGDIMLGTFIAAVGADSEDKRELFPELPASNKLVTDITEQCATIGELHHAIEARLMMPFEVYAELGEIIAQQKPGRVSDEEIIIFDSTGTALQDVAAAAIVYEKALAKGMGSKLNFSRQNAVPADILKK
jgi:ornithine cyclodeaminase/alanine dehydrogenase-like protein (mu-crystallin family)